MVWEGGRMFQVRAKFPKQELTCHVLRIARRCCERGWGGEDPRSWRVLGPICSDLGFSCEQEFGAGVTRSEWYFTGSSRPVLSRV